MSSIGTIAELGSQAAQARSPVDMAKIGEAAEAARDADRDASRAWAKGAAGTVATVGAYLATTGVGAVVGLGIAAAAGIAYAAYEGALALWDLLEPDLDGEKEQARVKDQIGWFISHGLPFPEWNDGRHGHLRYYANELQEAREVIEGTHPVIFRVGELFNAAISECDPYVLAALLVGGEGGRSWVLSGSPSSEQAFPADPKHLATNKQAVELLILAVATSIAQSRGLPLTHWQAVVDHAKAGWEQGIADSAAAGVYHRGATAFADSALQAEAMADYWRARLDAAEAAAPGTLGGLFGIAHGGRRATLSGSIFDRLGAEKPAVRRPSTVPDDVFCDVKPPATDAAPVSAATVAVGGGLAVAGGAFLLQTAAGAALRKLLGF